MTKLFHLSEVIDFAIEKEKDAVALYKGLSDQANAEDIKQFFHLLMREEQKHEVFYTELLDTVAKEQSAGVKGEEYQAYVQELIRASRTAPPLNLEKLTDLKIALDYAIAREKDSILFYVGLKNYLPSAADEKTDSAILNSRTTGSPHIYDSEKVDIIIKEEAKHAARLLQLKKRLYPDS